MIEPYLLKWQLSSPMLLAETPTSSVYHVCNGPGAEAVLKVLTPAGRKSETGAVPALSFFDGAGAVKLLEHDDGAQLLEYASGRHLKEFVVAGEDRHACEVACDVIERLHSQTVGFPNRLRTLQDHFRGLFSEARKHSTDSIFSMAAQIAGELLASPREVRVLHGDLHHTNIRECGARGWLAIDPHGLIGERTYDFANLFYNPDDMPTLVETRKRIETMVGIFARHSKIDTRRILQFAFAHGALSSAWCIEAGQNPERRLRITRLIHSLLR